MKKFTLAALIGMGITLTSSAQKKEWHRNQPMDSAIAINTNLIKEPRFFLNIHGGYAFGLGSTFKFYPDDIGMISITKTGNNTPRKLVQYSNPKKGLGDGLRIGGGISYIVNDFINVGLDVDYFRSTINKIRDSSYHQTQIPTTMGSPDESFYDEHTLTSYDATLLTFSPTITFKAISRPRWFIYNKLGGVITFRPNSLEKEVTDVNLRQGWRGFYKDSASRSIMGYDWGIKNPALGFMGAIGMQVKIAERLRAFSEIQFSHIVFVVRKRSLMEFLVNGTDQKNTLPVSVRETEFVQSFTRDFSDPNPNQPTQTLVQRIPITYIGLQFGMAYQLR